MAHTSHRASWGSSKSPASQRLTRDWGLPVGLVWVSWGPQLSPGQCLGTPILDNRLWKNYSAFMSIHSFQAYFLLKENWLLTMDGVHLHYKVTLQIYYKDIQGEGCLLVPILIHHSLLLHLHPVLCFLFLTMSWEMEQQHWRQLVSLQVRARHQFVECVTSSVGVLC